VVFTPSPDKQAGILELAPRNFPLQNSNLWLTLSTYSSIIIPLLKLAAQFTPKNIEKIPVGLMNTPLSLWSLLPVL
jgi:hypothetical protein